MSEKTAQKINKNEEPHKSGALSVVFGVLRTVFYIIVICIMIFTVLTVTKLNKSSDLFGYNMYIVLSDSMKSVFDSGDIIITRKTEPAELAEGDIITFKSTAPDNYGEIISHQIRSISIDAYDCLLFFTYGVATGVDDAAPVAADNVIGKYCFRIPKAGYVFNYLKTVQGYFVMILCPFLLLIGMEAARFVALNRQFRREQEAERARQSAQMEAERLKSQRLEEELLRLKARMDAKEGEGR